MNAKRAFLAVLGLAILIAALALTASVAAANGQETCPDGNGWVKEDLGNEPQYFTVTVDAGKTLTGWCYKAGTTVQSGTVNIVGPATYTVTSNVSNPNGNANLAISHVSFRFEDTEEPEVCEDEAATNYGQEGECEYPETTPEPDPVCEDETATNYGQEGECEYPETTPEPTPRPTETPEEPREPEGPQHEGCVLQFLVEDSGNWVNLSGEGNNPVYYQFPIEARGDHAVVNVPTWVNDGVYHLYYADGRFIGLLAVGREQLGTVNTRLICEVSPADPEAPDAPADPVCAECGPRIEEWYVNPDTDAVGRIMLVSGKFFIEAPAPFSVNGTDAFVRTTPNGEVYFMYSVAANGAIIDGFEFNDYYVPCSITVTLSQATINEDGTWTFVVLPMQWRSEWELAAQRFGFSADFVEAAMNTAVGGTFTVPAPAQQ